ncbi:putative transcription factor C2H2 family [Helianthus anomalus]
MEEEMFSLCNIMPVELALQRELEYRAKMQVEKNQHQNDLKPIVLAQGPPTEARKDDAELAPMTSQKAPMLQFSSSSQMFKEKAAFSCKACQLTFASVFHLSSHVQSQLHKVNISQMKKRREAISNPIWCELCRSSCSSLGEVEAHLNGSRHNSLLLSLARSRKRKRH